MHKSVQLRWIEQAETTAVREHALLQRAALEPYVNIVCTGTGLGWFDWPRGLVWTLWPHGSSCEIVAD